MTLQVNGQTFIKAFKERFRPDESSMAVHNKRRNRIEIMLGRLKGWQRAATLYDRRPKYFLSAVALFAIVIF